MPEYARRYQSRPVCLPALAKPQSPDMMPRPSSGLSRTGAPVCWSWVGGITVLLVNEVNEVSNESTELPRLDEPGRSLEPAVLWTAHSTGDRCAIRPQSAVVNQAPQRRESELLLVEPSERPSGGLRTEVRWLYVGSGRSWGCL